MGHIGEYIASVIFDIALVDATNHPGYDGIFSSGLLEGKSVDIKSNGGRARTLDIPLRCLNDHSLLPNYYLVLTGPPKAIAESCRVDNHPLLIHYCLSV